MGLEGKEDWKEGRESHTFSLQRGSKEWIMTAIEIFHVDRTRLYNRLALQRSAIPVEKRRATSPLQRGDTRKLALS